VTRIAFLGLGAMGRPMAGRLLDAGHDLRVWNRTPGRAEDLAGRGAERAATPADAARGVEFVITMLADPLALEGVVFGSDGIAETIGPDAVLVDMSTVGPTAIRRVGDRLRPVPVLDAPVLGTVPHAEAGSLTILAGGDADVLGRCAGVLEAMGTIRHVGRAGAGALVKHANNAASLTTLTCLGEVLALTDEAGLDPVVVLDAIGMGPLGSAVERWRERITGSVDRVDFRLALARKDLGLAIDEAATAGVPLSLPRATAGRFDDALAAGRGDEDLTAVVAFVRG
jgi:3-hydroxyisobutyrate dehydrogenase-like beta-hydroxyacid dehydrogenase